MSDLQSKFDIYVQSHLGRLLTQMDRDPDSPTYGCFDRNYWHYKVRDFPSSILQQGIFALEAIRSGHIQLNVSLDIIEQWCLGAVNALMNQTSKNGAVSEYYPYEHSYPAAAFSLSSICNVLYKWKKSAPHLLESVDWLSLNKLASHVASRIEEEAANQQGAGLAGLAFAEKLGIEAISKKDVEDHANRFFALQHKEGWFKEYGGADFGYLSVTIDALVDYYDATEDRRALDAIDRAVEFISICMGADGKLPSTLNSRNTDYVVPYGLVRTAVRNKKASWLVETLFNDMDQYNHFLWSIDDRYHSHYIYASTVRSLPYIQNVVKSEPHVPRDDLWLEGCGYWIVWSPDRKWNIFVGAKKGGVLRIHRKNKPPLIDNGWRIHENDRIWTTKWWLDKTKIEKKDGTIFIHKKCKRIKYFIPTTLKHGALRLFAIVFREKVIPILKQLMIYNSSNNNGPDFERTVEIDLKNISIVDRFTYKKRAKIKPAPRQNLRYVASADSFSVEELATSLLGEETLILNGEVEISTTRSLEMSEV